MCPSNRSFSSSTLRREGLKDAKRLRNSANVERNESENSRMKYYEDTSFSKPGRFLRKGSPVRTIGKDPPTMQVPRGSEVARVIACRRNQSSPGLNPSGKYPFSFQLKFSSEEVLPADARVPNSLSGAKRETAMKTLRPREGWAEKGKRDE